MQQVRFVLSNLYQWELQFQTFQSIMSSWEKLRPKIASSTVMANINVLFIKAMSFTMQLPAVACGWKPLQWPTHCFFTQWTSHMPSSFSVRHILPGGSILICQLGPVLHTVGLHQTWGGLVVGSKLHQLCNHLLPACCRWDLFYHTNSRVWCRPSRGNWQKAT